MEPAKSQLGRTTDLKAGEPMLWLVARTLHTQSRATCSPLACGFLRAGARAPYLGDIPGKGFSTRVASQFENTIMRPAWRGPISVGAPR
jgi:hypothetical protein